MNKHNFTPEQLRVIQQVDEKLDDTHRKWMEAFAAEHEISYSRLMRAAKGWLDTEAIEHLGVDINYGAMSDEFWVHYEGLTSVKAKGAKRSNFFRCAC